MMVGLMGVGFMVDSCNKERCLDARMTPAQQWAQEVAILAQALADGKRVMWRGSIGGVWNNMADMPLSSLVFSPEFEYHIVRGE